MKYVGFGRRFVAYLLDALILGVISGLVGMFIKNSLAVAAIEIVIWIGYAVVYQAKVGQTLGKKVMKIRVVDTKGKAPSALTFFLREVVGKTVSGIILGIGYLMVLWDGKKQGLHDKIASTYVVKV